MSSTGRRHFKLIYFNGRGLAETTRLCFAASGTPFEDVRIDRDDWAQLKPETAFGRLPVLEVDGGKKLSGSGAILRFAARETGLAGDSSSEQADVDEVADAFADLRPFAMKLRLARDRDQREELKRQFFAETMPPFLTSLQEVLKNNVHGQDYFVGNKLTYADLVAFHALRTLQDIHADLLSPYPLLAAHTDRVENTPAIRAWLRNRPDTDF